MKRIISILLLLGVCLPTLFDGCKPKTEESPQPNPSQKSPYFITTYGASVKDMGMLMRDTTRKEIFAFFGPKNTAGELIGVRQILFFLGKENTIAVLQLNEQMLPTQLAIQSMGGDLKLLFTFTKPVVNTGEVEIRCQNVVTKVTSSPIQANVGETFKLLPQLAQRLSSRKNGRVGEGARQAACTPSWVDDVRLALQASGCILSVIAPFVSAKDLLEQEIFNDLETQLEREAAKRIIGGALFVGNSGAMGLGCKGAYDNMEKVSNGECLDDPTAVDFITACPPSSWLSMAATVATGGSVGAFDAVTCAVGMLDFAIGLGRALARSWGDPHLISLDGVKFDFQAMGEFVAIKSTTDKFEVQVRYGAPGQSSVTYNQAIAVNTGADIVSFELNKSYLYANQQKINLTQLEGKPYPLSGGSALMKTNNGVLIITPNNDQILCKGRDFEFQPADNRKGKLIGLFGNYDGNMSNDGRTRDNKVINLLRPDELYPAFADSWRITQTESHFFYENGATTETYTDRAKPNDRQPYSSLSLADRQKAEALCRQAGVIREPELSNCILDVAITGDATYATLASLVAQANPSDNNFLVRADFSGKAAEGAVGITVGDKIYAGLGKQSKDWYVYDPATDQWTQKTTMPNAKNTYGYVGTFVLGTKIYFVGGAIDNTRTDQLWEYDVSADKWTQRKSIPGGARYNIAAFAAGGKGYALFGATGWGLGETDYPTKSATYEYDPATDNWTQKADFPAKPRGNNITNVEFNGIATVINGRPFVGGGSGSNTVWSDWYEYIPNRNVWEKRANSFGAKYYCSIGNTFYSINDRYVQSYDATSDTWTKFPGEEIYLPLQTNTLRGIYQLPVVNGKAYMGLGTATNSVGNKEWWSFTP
ncbi:hypothetical protein GCM10028807_41970 [Spirosoma daeguense]